MLTEEEASGDAAACDSDDRDLPSWATPVVEVVPCFDDEDDSQVALCVYCDYYCFYY
jgi:hypothetical protein